MQEDKQGYVYILINPSFKEDWVKIGKSSRPVDVRSKELDNTAVPLPFEIFATMQTSKYSDAVKAIHKRGIMINASFVFGLDGDTPETFRTTLDWIVKNKIETVTSHILTPYPCTALYERMKSEGRILTDNLSLYNTAHVVYQPKGMTRQELYKGYIRIYKEIYSLKNIFLRCPESKGHKSCLFPV